MSKSGVRGATPSQFLVWRTFVQLRRANVRQRSDFKVAQRLRQAAGAGADGLAAHDQPLGKKWWLLL